MAASHEDTSSDTRAQHRYRTACPPRSHHNSLSSPFNQHPRRSQSCNAVRCFAKTPVARAELEKTIAEALDGHICRCTGYIKYHEAVRAVILADSKRYLAANQ